MSMSVSIIIPVYNVAPYITDCIQSVMRQTYKGELECLVVDDCGNDNSIEIAKNLVSQYKGPISFRFLHHEYNRGLSAARNTGIRLSIGDYLYFLDSDDWITDDCIERLALPLQTKDYDIVVGDYDQTSNSYVHLSLDASEGEHFSHGPIFDIACNRGVYVMSVNKLFRKRYLTENQLLFEEGKIHEDEIMAFDISCSLKSIYVVKEITYHYRIRENSIMGLSRNNDKKLIEGRLGVLKCIQERVESKYSHISGIYDFYMFWVQRMFKMLSSVYLNRENLELIQSLSEGFLKVIPKITYLDNKHNRLIYFVCKKDQTYLRYKYVTEVYSRELMGRVMRNVLDLLPHCQ